MLSTVDSLLFRNGTFLFFHGTIQKACRNVRNACPVGRKMSQYGILKIRRKRKKVGTGIKKNERTKDRKGDSASTTGEKDDQRSRWDPISHLSSYSILQACQNNTASKKGSNGHAGRKVEEENIRGVETNGPGFHIHVCQKSSRRLLRKDPKDGRIREKRGRAWNGTSRWKKKKTRRKDRTSLILWQKRVQKWRLYVNLRLFLFFSKHWSKKIKNSWKNSRSPNWR